VSADPEVHAASRSSLDAQMLFERPLLFLNAFSGDEARQLLQAKPTWPWSYSILRWSGRARIDLVHLRHAAALRNTRIILLVRPTGTGAGLDALIENDISDYRTRAELTVIGCTSSLPRQFAPINSCARRTQAEAAWSMFCDPVHLCWRSRIATNSHPAY
jgi:hypothetical protein